MGSGSPPSPARLLLPLDLGHGRLTGPPAPEAGLKQPSLGSMPDQSLGQRNAAPVTSTTARPSLPEYCLKGQTGDVVSAGPAAGKRGGQGPDARGFRASGPAGGDGYFETWGAEGSQARRPVHEVFRG